MEKNKNNTKLSSEYWKLANTKLHPRISWSIKATINHTTPIQIQFNSKLKIVDDPKEILLSKRSEVISQCHHRSKCKLKTLVSNKQDRDIT